MVPPAPSGRSSSEASWEEYRRLVVSELERIDAAMRELDRKLDDALFVRDKGMSELRVEVAILKTKATIFGAIAGTAATVLLQVLMKFLPH